MFFILNSLTFKNQIKTTRRVLPKYQKNRWVKLKYLKLINNNEEKIIILETFNTKKTIIKNVILFNLVFLSMEVDKFNINKRK